MFRLNRAGDRSMLLGPVFRLILVGHWILPPGALLGDPSWGISAAGRERMLVWLRDVERFNVQTDDPEARFQGIHLDIEPWIGSGESMSWVEPLIESYRVAASELADSGMSLAVDVAGSKMAKAELADRQAMLDAVDRVILMQYEIHSLELAETRTRRFLEGLTADGTRGVVVGFRSSDFADVLATGIALENAFQATREYRGWSVFDYEVD